MAEQGRKIIEEILYSITKEDLPKGSSIPSSFQKPGEAKDIVFTNAIKLYAPNVEMEEIIFVYDFNLFKHDGTNSIMFTTEGFATDKIRKDKRAAGITTPIRYADLSHISSKGKLEFTLHFRDGQEITVHPGLFRDYIRVAVNRIIEALSSDQLPQTDAKNEPAPEPTAEEAFSKAIDFYFGKTVPEDKAQAAYWFEKAAQHGHTLAQFNLGIMYDAGEGVPVDKEKAVHWYEKAAEQGDASAQFNLGLSYQDGDGVPKNRDKALELFRMAADQGHEKAKKKVAEYEVQTAEAGKTEPEPAPEPEQLPEAKKAEPQPQPRQESESTTEPASQPEAVPQTDDTQALLKQLAQQQAEMEALKAQLAALQTSAAPAAEPPAHSTAESQTESEQRLGPTPEPEPTSGPESMPEDEPAQESEPTADEAFSKAIDFYFGKNVPLDKAQAAHWFAQAAKQGHGEAAFDLAVMYAKGEGGFPKDEKQYLTWLEKSALDGFAKAQSNLALVYYTGRHGVSVDKEKAIHWYEQAADQEDANAQLLLAIMYLNGNGIEKNACRALHYFALAAENGEQKAISYLLDNEAKKMFHTASDAYQEGNRIGALQAYHAALRTEEMQNNRFSITGSNEHFGRPEDYQQAASLLIEEKAPWAKYYLGKLYHDGDTDTGIERDLSRSFQCVQEASEGGFGLAHAALIHDYYYGREYGVPKDRDKALALLEAAARSPDPEARYKAAKLYDWGFSEEQLDIMNRVGKDFQKALALMTEVAETGHADALFQLSMMYDPNNKDYPNDEEKQAYYQDKAADLGHTMASLGKSIRDGSLAETMKKVEAFNNIKVNNLIDEGVKYYDGDGVPRDYNKARALFEEAAEKGSAAAMFNLGIMYFHGQGVPEDKEKAVHWYEKAAELGDASAQYNLGEMYSHGKTVPLSYKKALDYYQKAADQGEIKALSRLADMYENGLGVYRDKKKVLELLQRGADLGDARIQTRLGRIYETGHELGVSKDLAKAFDYYQKAADQGYDMGLIRLAKMYYGNSHIPRDLSKVYYYYKKAADQGSSRAQLSLSDLYYHGTGVPKDKVKSFEWCKKAAEQGDWYAQHALGRKYYEGDGVPQDNAKAEFWYEKAAEGNPDIASSLADMFFDGKGIDYNRAKARKWYQVAADRGDKYSERQLIKYFR